MSTAPNHPMVQLDQSQLEFCASANRNIRLLAPAGCGKTLSLLHRCNQLLKRSESHPRFLIVTFTKAAAAELKERLARDPEFKSVGDHVRITTLNAYGWQRIRDQVRNPKLLANQNDYHFAMLNQLRPVWEDKSRIEETINRHKSATRTLMNVMDNLKSMGFDHTRDTNRDRVQSHFAALEQQGLSWRIREQFDLLMGINVLEPPRGSDDAERAATTSIRQFYDRFFVFWREATSRLRAAREREEPAAGVPSLRGQRRRHR